MAKSNLRKKELEGNFSHGRSGWATTFYSLIIKNKLISLDLSNKNLWPTLIFQVVLMHQ